MRTDAVDGYLLDRGFQILLTAYPEVKRQLDLDGLDLQAFAPGASICVDGRRHQVGDPLRDPRSLPATVLNTLLTPADKLRILRLRQRVTSGDPRRLLRQPDGSTIDHLRELGFSKRAIQHFFRPLFAGIQLDPELATSRRMFDIIFRSLSLGESAVPSRGMGAIPEQMAARLSDGTVLCDMAVSAVTPTSVTTADGSVQASHVVVATDGPTAARLLDLPVPGSRSVGCVWFSADRSPSGDRLIMLDGTSKGPAYNVAVLSDVAPSYAPRGKALIAAATPGDTEADVDERVKAQLRTMVGPEVDAWDVLRVDRIPHGQPDQRAPFSPKRANRTGAGIWVCGDHRDTGSIQGALFSGRRTAEAILTA